MTMVRRLLLLAVGCVALSAGTSIPDVAAETIWGEPELLSDGLTFDWFPESNADAAGAARLVWEATLQAESEDTSNGMGSAVVLSQQQSGGWSEPAAILVKDSYNAGRPILVSDGRYAHMIVRYVPPDQNTRNLAGIYYSRAALGSDLTNAHSWTTPRPISQSSAYWAQLVTLPDDGLVVVYNQLTDTLIDNDLQQRSTIFSRRSPDHGETWDPPVRVSDHDLHSVRTSLAAIPDGSTLIAAWDLGYDNLVGQGRASGFATAVSRDGGRTWSTPVSYHGQYQQSTVATNGQVTILVYRSTAGDRLHFRRSDDLGGAWSADEIIPDVIARPYPGDHNFDKLSLAVDGDGHFLLAYAGADPDAPYGLSVFVTSYRDAGWSEPEPIASPDGYPEYPRLTVALGNQIHVVYFVRDDPWDTKEATIWIVSGQSDAQAIPPQEIEPAVAPTPVPTPTIQPVQLSTFPTPISAPDPIPRSSSSTTGLQTTMHSPLLLIVGGTSASLLVVLVVYAAIRLPDRIRRH